MDEVRFLTEKEIIFINAMVVKQYTPTEEIRVKEPSLLNSAVNRPKQSAFGEDAYPTIWLKAAALFESTLSPPGISAQDLPRYISFYG